MTMHIRYIFIPKNPNLNHCPESFHAALKCNSFGNSHIEHINHITLGTIFYLVKNLVPLSSGEVISLFFFQIRLEYYDEELIIRFPGYMSNSAKKFLLGLTHFLVIPCCGIDNIAISLANPSQQPPRLIMVARFNEQKDQATLLKAIALLSNHPLHLDLVGSGSSLSSCKALAQSLGIADRVSFLGDRTDVYELLTQYQIFILSTHYEGLLISILEAMRAGLPIVATNVNGVPEEIVHSKTGLLVPPKDVQLLADALSTLIQSPDLRQQMGKAGRQKFLQEFTVERMIAETRTIYEQILKN